MRGMISRSRLDKNIPSSVALGSTSASASAVAVDGSAVSRTELVVVNRELASSMWTSPGKMVLRSCIIPLGIGCSESRLFWDPLADRMLILILREIEGSCLKFGGNDPGRTARLVN
jgi:hypothetical protein